MAETIVAQIAALKSKTVGQLREVYLEKFGEPRPHPLRFRCDRSRSASQGAAQPSRMPPSVIDLWSR
jgi:hypothetical protein